MHTTIFLNATPYQLSRFRPFPEFALFTCIAVRLCQSSQWLADIIIVAHIDYDYGKRQSISSSPNPARMGQTRKNSAQERGLFSRSASRLYQTTTDSRDWRLFGHLLLHRPTVSLSWRYPHRLPSYIPALNGVPL